VVKVILREALYQEEIPRDPTAGVGKVKYRKEERGGCLQNVVGQLQIVGFHVFGHDGPEGWFCPETDLT
jgi:hypothetical protein